ncbi:hypothetical protein FF1_019211 [Malus domestica]
MAPKNRWPQIPEGWDSSVSTSPTTTSGDPFRTISRTPALSKGSCGSVFLVCYNLHRSRWCFRMIPICFTHKLSSKRGSTSLRGLCRRPTLFSWMLSAKDASA